jgi:transposase-like protein
VRFWHARWEGARERHGELVAKTRLARFRGIRPDKFYLRLKETEFRFNHRRDDLYSLLLREFRKSPL